MRTLQLLEQLGADPDFAVTASIRQQILDELQKAPKINFFGIVTPEDDNEDDEKEQEDEKDGDQESDEKQRDDKTVN